MSYLKMFKSKLLRLNLYTPSIDVALSLTPHFTYENKLAQAETW